MLKAESGRMLGRVLRSWHVLGACCAACLAKAKLTFDADVNGESKCGLWVDWRLQAACPPAATSSRL